MQWVYRGGSHAIHTIVVWKWCFVTQKQTFLLTFSPGHNKKAVNETRTVETINDYLQRSFYGWRAFKWKDYVETYRRPILTSNGQTFVAMMLTVFFEMFVNVAQSNGSTFGRYILCKLSTVVHDQTSTTVQHFITLEFQLWISLAICTLAFIRAGYKRAL